MKTFNVTSLPNTIEYKGETLKLFISTQFGKSWELEAKGLTVCLVSCMSKNLRGKTDLFGKLYSPSTFIYANMKPEEFEKWRETVKFWKKQFFPRTSKWQKETMKSLKSNTPNPFDDGQTFQKIQALKEIKAL